ncbi:MAG: glycogen debranching N-terminal domain-containing protein, partial [Candidatus Rokuibacteriota bacterium]
MDEFLPAPDFHIQASPEAAALQKLVLKHGESFLVSDRRGDLPAHFEGELGFYHAGTRHLRWLELRLDGERPLLLDADIAPDNDRILVGLTNADTHAPDGRVLVPRNTIYLDRQLTLVDAHLLQTVAISSFLDAVHEVTLELIFAADFRDVFEVRGTHRARRGQLLGEDREGGRVRLAYRGLDDVIRVTTLRFDPPPMVVAANRAVYRLRLTPGDTVRMDLAVSAGDGAGAPRPADAV